MKETGAVPPPNVWLERWFSSYSRRRLRKDFHQMRLLGEGPGELDGPLVVYANHSSWWDPMVALAIRSLFFAGRQAYAPIDAEMLERYGIFKHLGFIGVDRSTPRGVVRYLDAAEEVLGRPGTMLFVTPQGRFADVRERPPGFQRGLGLLAQRVKGACFLPAAIEYVFWEESKPEVLLHFGEVQRLPGDGQRDAASAKLEGALEAAQDRLAQAVIRRSAGEFRTVLRGRTGVGGVYDFWRSLRAWSAGRAPDLRHGKL